jgi:hypothetical protein
MSKLRLNETTPSRFGFIFYEESTEVTLFILWRNHKQVYHIVNRIRLGNSMQTYCNRPHYICFCPGLCKKWSVHRHVCVAFFAQPTIAVCWFNLIIPSRDMTQWFNENIAIGCSSENTMHTWRWTGHFLHKPWPIEGKMAVKLIRITI